MRKRLIDAGILAVVFVVAVVVFSYLTNRGNNNMAADMGSPTLPGVYFSYNGYGLNPLNGYTNKMDASSMRDTITPVSGQSMELNIETYNNKIDAVDYTFYSLDGKTSIASGTLKNLKEKNTLEFEQGAADQESLLMLTMHTENRKVYYYTRVVNSDEYNTAQCLEYITNFHNNALAKAENTGVGAAIEPNEEGDNTTLQHVTVHSDYDHVTWGELNPVVAGTERLKVMETNSTYTSVLLEYQVRCAGEENAEDLYNVKEFFRVRCVGDTFYLLNYDRTMDQIFDGTKNVLSQKGILLGLSPYDVPYMVNEDGTIVSFVQANELWNYNRNKDELSLLFSFADAENTDERNLTGNHVVKLLSVEDNGDTTFAVYGYMNRGAHEGEVGAAIYYYNIEQNSIDEKVFIPSEKSAEIASEELGRLVYYSIPREMLYVLVDGTLYEIDIQEDTRTALVKDLGDGQYVVSEDGHLVAYQTAGSIDEANTIMVKNLKNGKEYKIKAEKNECIKPLGFVNNDFVFGTARKADVGQTISGETVVPMYQVKIHNTKNEVIKTYEAGENYVLDVLVEDRMITLKRAVRSGSTYSSIESDYIASNEERKESNIYLESYSTELKETQMRLTFEDGISDKQAKVLKPKQVLFENPTTISFGSENLKDKYYVYGYGKLQGIYDKAGYAVQKADDVSGVVVSSGQQYVWERGNRYLQYAVSGKEEVIAKLQELLGSGTSPIEAVSQVSEKKPLDLTGCTTEEMLYIVNKGTPVIGMIDSSQSVILVGYDETYVSYINTGSGERSAVSYGEMDQMLSGTGRAFIGYLE